MQYTWVLYTGRIKPGIEDDGQSMKCTFIYFSYWKFEIVYFDMFPSSGQKSLWEEDL